MGSQTRSEQYIGARPKILVDRKPRAPDEPEYDSDASHDEQAGDFVELCPVGTHPGSGEPTE